MGQRGSIVAQFLFLVLLFAIGLAALSVLRRRMDAVLLCLLAFPFGSTLWVIFSLVLLVPGLPYTEPAMRLQIEVLMLAAIALNVRLGLPSRRETVAAIITTAVFLGTAALAVRYNYAFCSNDSWQLIVWGKGLANEAISAQALQNMVYSYGIFIPALHSAATLYGFDYLYAHVPVLTFWFLGVFSYVLFDAVRKCQLSKIAAAAWAGLGLLLVGSSYFVVFQGFCLLTNLTAAMYLFFGVALFCRYLTDRKVEYLGLGSLLLACFSIARMETTFVAVLAWIPLLERRDLRVKSLLLCYASYALIVGAWFLKALATRGWEDGAIGSGAAMIALVLTLAAPVLCIVLRSHRFSRFRPASWLLAHLSDVALYAIGTAAAAFTFVRLEHAVTSGNAIALNLLGGRGHWGVTWPALGLLALLAAWLRPGKCHRLLATVTAGGMLVIYTLVFLRNPYRPGWGDSANRMFIHLFPLICYYLITRYASNLAPRSVVEESASELQRQPTR